MLNNETWIHVSRDPWFFFCCCFEEGESFFGLFGFFDCFQCFPPRCSKQHHTFIPYALPKVLPQNSPFSHIRGGPKTMHSIFQQKLLLQVVLKVFVFIFVMDRLKQKVQCKNKRFNLGCTPLESVKSKIKSKMRMSKIPNPNSLLCFKSLPTWNWNQSFFKTFSYGFDPLRNQTLSSVPKYNHMESRLVPPLVPKLGYKLGSNSYPILEIGLNSEWVPTIHVPTQHFFYNLVAFFFVT